VRKNFTGISGSMENGAEAAGISHASPSRNGCPAIFPKPLVKIKIWKRSASGLYSKLELVLSNSVWKYWQSHDGFGGASPSERDLDGLLQVQLAGTAVVVQPIGDVR